MIRHLPLGLHRAAFEPIRGERLVLLMLITCGQDVGALKSLVNVYEDVEYRDEALGGVSRACHICIYG